MYSWDYKINDLFDLSVLHGCVIDDVLLHGMIFLATKTLNIYIEPHLVYYYIGFKCSYLFLLSSFKYESSNCLPTGLQRECFFCN